MKFAAELNELFPRPEGPGEFSRKFSVMGRGGHLLLALPEEARAAVATLELYPAQRPIARAVKSALRWMAARGLPRPLPSLNHPFTGTDPFTEFLCALAPSLKTGAGQIGIFAGNPAVVGRRWIVVLFDNGEPVISVKAGANEAGRRLLAKELAFLEQAQAVGIEVPRAKCESARVTAFAMDFLRGASPRAATPRAIYEVLRPWLREDQSVPLGSVPAWRRLAETGGADQALANLPVRPAVMHGDFAPWNVKVDSGRWRVFDWERGELTGVPCWDWLHFLVQSAMLVERLPPVAIAERLEGLFHTDEYRDYAQAAQVHGQERALALGYVRYCNLVQPQVAGSETMKELEGHLTERWRRA